MQCSVLTTSLLSDANSIASKHQMHASSHTRTCFKYSNNRSYECRFLFPRELVAQSHIDRHGVIHLEWNHQWINPWNPVLASLLRSNHDISFIPTAVYYMTNYTTKYDVSQYQLIMTAAIVKQAMEAGSASSEIEWSPVKFIQQEGIRSRLHINPAHSQQPGGSLCLSRETARCRDNVPASTGRL